MSTKVIKKVAFLAILVGTIFIGASAVKPKPALCVYCPTYACYGACGAGCVCLKRGMEISGSCYSQNKTIPPGFSILE